MVLSYNRYRFPAKNSGFIHNRRHVARAAGFASVYNTPIMTDVSPASLPATAPDDPFFAGIARGVPFARVFTGRAEPVLPADLADALFGRGFVPGFTDPGGTTAALQEAGLAEARFTLGAEGYRVVSLSSSRGNGCLVMVRETLPGELPDDYLARRAVPKPKTVVPAQSRRARQQRPQPHRKYRRIVDDSYQWLGGNRRARRERRQQSVPTRFVLARFAPHRRSTVANR